MSYHEYANGSRRHYNGHQFKVELLSQAELTRTPKGIDDCQHAHTHVFFSGKLLADAYYCHDCGKVYPVAPANSVAEIQDAVNNQVLP